MDRSFASGGVEILRERRKVRSIVPVILFYHPLCCLCLHLPSKQKSTNDDAALDMKTS